MCGICGNYNDVKEDDLRDSNGNLTTCDTQKTKRGRLSCQYNAVGNSWEVPSKLNYPGSVFLMMTFSGKTFQKHGQFSFCKILKHIGLPMTL